MLICANCQSENPELNKFCQKCGNSLTQKDCEQCGAKVAWSEERCQNCGALTGTVWWAIISRSPDWQPLAPSVQQVPSTAAISSATAPQSATSTSQASELSVPTVTTNPENAPAQADSPLPVAATPVENATEAAAAQTAEMGNISTQEETLQQTTAQMSPAVMYLDPQQRYQLLDPLMPDRTTVGVRVLDCQPLQASPLTIALQQSGSGLGSQSSTLDTDASKAIGVPDIAQPYLKLRLLVYESVPAVHDAWQQDKQAVVLLSDRSRWQLVEELWKNDQVPPLQILRWMDDIASLWAALEPWHCRQSLLELTNLRVDEDQSLSLQQLYGDPEATHLTLQDLGKMWLMLFQKSGRTQFSSLTPLLRDLNMGEIESCAQLRDRLKQCANELQPTAESEEIEEKTVNPQESEPQTTPFSYVEAPVAEEENFTTESSESDDLPTVVLPKHLNRLDDAGGTHVGRQRNHNEDFFYIQTKINKQENPRGRAIEARGLYILCDGMGGHASGEVASAMAVETLKRYFEANWNDKLPDEDSILDAISLANQEIYQTNQKNARSGSGRMGTTLVMVLIQDTKVAIAHVGDSRLYRLTRKKGLEQLTVDHEVGQREIQRGVEEAIAYSRPDAYQLTQALGPRDENFVKPDVRFLDLDEDTLLMLCSDGLTDNDLLETHWNNLVPLLNSRASLEQGVNQLIDLANQYNGHDNITAVLARAKLRPNLEQQRFV